MTQAFVNLGVTQAMSPNVGNFVHDLVEMAKAMETLPQVQAELERAQRDISDLSQTVQERELAIIGYKEQIEGLHSKVRSLEVERDDASFRVLEAEDKADSVLALVRTASVDLAMIVQKLDPPKSQPEPVKYPEHVAVHKWDDNETKDQSVKDPTANTMTTNSLDTASSANNQDTAHTSTSEPDASGWNHNIQPIEEAPKSDVNPIVKAEGTSSETASSHSASSTVVDTNAGKAEDKEPSDKYSDEWYDWRQREDKRQGYHRF